MQGPQGPSHRGGCPWSCPELRSGGRSSGSNRWRYVSTIFQAIFSGDIHWNLGLNNRPEKHGRYLHWSWRSPIDRNPRGWGYPGFPRFFQLGSEKSLWDDLKYVGARDIISLCIWPLTIHIYIYSLGMLVFFTHSKQLRLRWTDSSPACRRDNGHGWCRKIFSMSCREKSLRFRSLAKGKSLPANDGSFCYWSSREGKKPTNHKPQKKMGKQGYWGVDVLWLLLMCFC